MQTYWGKGSAQAAFQAVYHEVAQNSNSLGKGEKETIHQKTGKEVRRL
jgi:hypothetical protein